jgi:diacylglycerol kinase (ATP)
VQSGAAPAQRPIQFNTEGPTLGGINRPISFAARRLKRFGPRSGIIDDSAIARPALSIRHRPVFIRMTSPAVADRKLVVIALNRTAGSGRRRRRVDGLQAALSAAGFEVLVEPQLAAALALAKAAHADGRLHALVAAGGDGTVNAVVGGTPPGLPLAVFPMGTENLLARFIRMPRDPLPAAAVIAAGRTLALDCGKVTRPGFDDPPRLFLITLGVGFDAEVVRRLAAVRRGNIGHLSYLRPAWQAMRRYAFPELRVTTLPAASNAAIGPAPEVEYACRWCFLQNIPAYGGGLNFTPLAVGTDGLLDLCLFGQAGVLRGFRYLWKVLRGRHRALPECTIGQAAAVRVESPAADVPVQIDGDAAGVLPITVEVVQRRALLIIPRDANGDG